MKTRLLFISVPIALLATVVGSCHYLENPRLYFATYDEMAASGIINAGWVPSYLPRSARDIDETHNIDTNRMSIEFRYSAGDSRLVEEACVVLVKDDQGTKYVCPPFDKQSAILVLRADGSGSYESSRHGI